MPVLTNSGVTTAASTAHNFARTNDTLSLLSLLPLLEARLDAPFFHRAVASDASELAAGVVSTPLTAHLSGQLWPLCSSRHHAVCQAKLNAQRSRSDDAAIRVRAADPRSRRIQRRLCHEP